MKSLKTTVIVSLLLLTLIGSGTLLSIALSYSRTSLHAVLEEDMTSMANTVSEAISSETDSKFQLINTVAHIPSIQNEEYTNESKQDQLDSISKQDYSILGFIVSDLTGEARMTESKWDIFDPQDFLQDALMGKKSIQGPVIDEATNKSALYYIAPLFNENHVITNVLYLLTDGSVLSDLCSRYKVGETGYSFVVDRTTGELIGHPDINLVYEGFNILEDASNNAKLTDKVELLEDMMSGSNDVGYYTEDGIEYVLSYAPILGTNWAAGVIVEYEEFSSHLKTLQIIMLLCTFIIVIIGNIIALFIGKAIRPLKQVGDAINEIATGNADLTKRLEIKHTKKEISEVVNGFNNFVEKLQSIIASVKESQNNLISADNSLQTNSHETASSITEIIANIESVNNQIINQVGSVDETAGAVNQIASNIESLEHLIINQATGVSQASSAIEEMVGNINSVNNSVEKMFGSFKTLEDNAKNGIDIQNDVNAKIRLIEEQSKMLQDANQAIADIAEQTNLLAMNAAIESAHAGEVGKGFAVVADEIRKLSETSTEQSNSIGNELNKIMESITDVVHASQQSTSAFNAVAQNIQATDEIVRQIKNAMDEQIIGSKQITQVLQEMNDSSSEVRAASSEMAAGNKHILKEIQQLQNATAGMKDSISEMSVGAQRINHTGAALSDVSNQVTNCIEGINQEINLFKV